MTTLLTAILIVFFTLFIYIAWKYGILSSWSETFYKLEESGKGWIFSVVMMFLGVASGAIMFQLADGQWFQFVGLFAAFPIGFVGAAPKFSFVKGLELERQVHFFAAKMSGVSSFIWIILMAVYVDWVLILSIPIAAVLALTGYLFAPKRIWWIEMVMFFSVFMVFAYLTI